MEGEGQQQQLNGSDGMIQGGAPPRLNSHDAGSASGRAGYGESLGDMKKRRKE